MAMDLNAKAAYIRGMMAGMEFDPESKNGKVVAAMMELLEEMAAVVTEHDNALDQVYEELDAFDEDLDDLVTTIFGEVGDEEDEDEDELSEEAVYEVTCPTCNFVTTVDEETLMNQELVCPNCGAAFAIELESEEDAVEDPEA